MNRTTKIISIAAVATALAGGATYAVAQSQDDVTGDDLAAAGTAALTEAGDGTITEVDVDANGYDVEVLRPDGTKIDVDLDHDFNVIGSRPDTDDDGTDDNDAADDADDVNDRDDNDNDDVAVGDAERQQAGDAALAETGDGTVTDVEFDRNASGDGYDVEVRLTDGSEVDVELDAQFNVLRTEVDD